MTAGLEHSRSKLYETYLNSNHHQKPILASKEGIEKVAPVDAQVAGLRDPSRLDRDDTGTPVDPPHKQVGSPTGITEYLDPPENPGTGHKLTCKIDPGSVPALRQALKVGPLHAECDTRHLRIEPTTSATFLNTLAAEPLSPAPLVTVPYLLSLKHPLNHL